MESFIFYGFKSLSFAYRHAGLKGKDLIGFVGQFVEVIHPSYRASARSHQTVGFHAHASDIEIALELVHLAHDIELFTSTFFK